MISPMIGEERMAERDKKKGPGPIIKGGKDG